MRRNELSMPSVDRYEDGTFTEPLVSLELQAARARACSIIPKLQMLGGLIQAIWPHRETKRRRVF